MGFIVILALYQLSPQTLLLSCISWFVVIVILNLFWILLGVLSALDDTYIAMGNDHFVDDLPVYPSNIATFHSYVNYQGVNPILFPSIADCTLMFDG